jgi:hypothetical protein
MNPPTHTHTRTHIPPPPVCCADIVERFDTFIFLSVAWIQSAGESSHQLLDAAFYIVVGEVIVDWTKHSFVTKFNKIHHSLYGDFLETLMHEMLPRDHNHEGRVDPTQVVARRVGLGVLPLACVSTRFLLTHVISPVSTSLAGVSLWLRVSIWLTAFVCLLALKLLLSSLLMYGSCKYVARRMRKRNATVGSSAYARYGISSPAMVHMAGGADLSKIDRYSLFKSRIPT